VIKEHSQAGKVAQAPHMSGDVQLPVEAKTNKASRMKDIWPLLTSQSEDFEGMEKVGDWVRMGDSQNSKKTGVWVLKNVQG
jgi:hypothetical protein